MSLISDNIEYYIYIEVYNILIIFLFRMYYLYHIQKDVSYFIWYFYTENELLGAQICTTFLLSYCLLSYYVDVFEFETEGILKNETLYIAISKFLLVYIYCRYIILYYLFYFILSFYAFPLETPSLLHLK